MLLAKIENSNVVEYPLTFQTVRRRLGNISMPMNPDIAILEQYGYVEVKPLQPPVYDPDVEIVQEGTPQLVSGEWVQTWNLRYRFNDASHANEILKQVLNREIENALTTGYPDFEIKSWPTKSQEASMLINDPNHPAPLIRSEAQVIGIDPVTHAQNILSKAQVFSLVVGIGAGLRSKYTDMISQTTVISEMAELIKQARAELLNILTS